METTLAEILRDKGSHVCQIHPEASISEAAKVMKLEHVGALLVMEEDAIVGIISERDMVTSVLATCSNPCEVKVHSVMSREVAVTKSSLSVRKAMRIVTRKRIRHLPIVEDNKLLGVVSIGDLTKRVIAEEEGVIHSLYSYIYGTYPG